MEELNLIELFKYYLKNYLIIFLTIVLSLLIGYTYIEYFQVPKYKGTTTIILVEKSNNGVNDLVTQNEILVNEKLVTTYSEIIKSKRVLNRVKKDLDLNMSIEKLTKAIEVSAIEETSIIKLEVENKSSKKAAAIANKIAEVFEEEITQIYNLENVSIVDKATIEDKPYNVNIPLQIAIYALIGFVVAICICTIKFFFNNSIKNKSEIESKLNIAVLGEIPITTKLNTVKRTRNKESSEKKEKSKETIKIIENLKNKLNESDEKNIKEVEKGESETIKIDKTPKSSEKNSKTFMELLKVEKEQLVEATKNNEKLRRKVRKKA